VNDIDAKQLAIRIVRRVMDAYANNEGIADVQDQVSAMIELATRPPAGHIMEHDGTVRKVLGTLPVTADGCVATHESILHHPSDGPCYMVPDGHDRPAAAKVYGGALMVPVASCYSTREAAEAAQRAAGGGV
jgi:hypothetical protein